MSSFLTCTGRDSQPSGQMRQLDRHSLFLSVTAGMPKHEEWDPKYRPCPKQVQFSVLLNNCRLTIVQVGKGLTLNQYSQTDWTNKSKKTKKFNDTRSSRKGCNKVTGKTHNNLTKTKRNTQVRIS